MPEENRGYKKFVVLGLIFFGLAGAVFFFKKAFLKPARKVEKAGTVVSPTTSKSLYSASLFAEKTSYKVGDEVKLMISLSSSGKEVVGFDIALSYDPSLLEFKSATSLNPDFSVSFVDAGGHIALTGIKSPSAKTPYVFESERLVEVTFVAKAPGKTSLEIKRKAGKDVSQLVDNTSQKLPLEGDRVEITLVP